jgi:hypothetical protein
LGEPLVLGGLGDGLVLGGELGDARPLLLLGLDRLVRGLLRALVLEHAVEDRPGGDLILVAGGVLVFLKVGLVGRDIRDVRQAASDHGDVERLPRHRAGVDDQVGGVDGRALRAVGGDRVAQLDALGHVSGGQDDPAASPTRAGALHGQAPVLVALDDGPGVAVLHPPLPRRQAAVVVTGDDHVAPPSRGPVVQGDTLDSDLTGEYPISAGALVQGDHGVAGLGDQDARPPGGQVALPGVVGGVEHLVVVASDDATLFVVEVDHSGIAAAEPEGGGLLPLAGEAADVGQLRRPVLVVRVAVADE